jgi:hypothetical protein
VAVSGGTPGVRRNRMIIVEAQEPLIIRLKDEECFTIRKSIKGGYIINTALPVNEKLYGKILIEPDVEPVIMGKPEEEQ